MNEAVTYKRHPLYTNWFFGDNGTCFQTHYGKSAKILNPNPNSKGYVKVKMKVEGIFKNVSMHRLVAQTFLGLSDLEVNHKNKNRNDNRLCNLEYCTRGENVRHSQNGRKRFVYKVSNDSRYCIQICHNKKLIRAGKLFECKEEAYKEAFKIFKQTFNYEPWEE